VDLTVSVKAGELIYRQGDAAGELFLVQDGLVELVVGEGTEERRLTLLGRGQPFGERGALEGRPRAETARAAQDTLLVRLDRELLAALVRHSPELALLLLTRLAERLQKAEHALVEMTATPQPTPAMSTVPMLAPTPPAAIPPVAAPSAPAAPAVAEHRVSAPAPPTPPVPPAPVAARPLARARLVHEAGAEVVLSPSHDSVIGRADPKAGIAPEVDLSALPNVLATERKSVSRRHARIRPQPDGYYLSEEAGVANGTFVNKRRLTPGEPVRLDDGDELAFGRAVLVFRLG
jgi:hypothetical protein